MAGSGKSLFEICSSVAQVVFLVSAGIALSFLLCELALRIAGISHLQWVVMDKDTGWRLRPGQEGWSEDEARVYLRINSEGLRDREHAKAKPPNALRIAVLGDSYAEARQVPMEQTFWARMENELNDCSAIGHRQVEVINFGVDGYGTGQELETLRRHVWDYSPDIVLLAFVPSNDISDNSRALGAETDRPYFVYKGSNLILDTSFREAPGYRLRQLWPFTLYYEALPYSRLLQLVHRARRSVSPWGAGARQPGRAAAETGGREPGLEDAVYREPEDRVTEDAWRVTEGLLLLMRDEVRAKGTGFVVVTLTRGIQVHPDPKVRHQFMERARIQDIFYPDSRLAAFGKREGFEVLTLAPLFQTYAEQHQVFLHGFGDHKGQGHWNENAHRLAGDLISRRVCEHLQKKTKN